MQDPRSLGHEYRPGWLSLNRNRLANCSKEWTIKAYCFRDCIRWCLQTVLKAYFEDIKAGGILCNKEFKDLLPGAEAMATHLGISYEGFWLPSLRQSQWKDQQAPLTPGTTETHNATSTGLLILFLNWAAFRKTEANKYTAKSMLQSF